MWVWIAQAIGAVLLQIAGSLVWKFLTAAGIGVATYTGVSVTLGWLKDSMVSSFAHLPSNVLGILALMQVGSCVSMMVSAVIVKLSLNGMQSDTVKRWVKK